MRVFSNDTVMEFEATKCAVLTIKNRKMANSDEMKEKAKTEYYDQVRKILETKPNGGNIITEINTWTISLLRYCAAFLDWAGAVFQQMYRRTRKFMTIHRTLNPKSDVARI